MCQIVITLSSPFVIGCSEAPIQKYLQTGSSYLIMVTPQENYLIRQAYHGIPISVVGFQAPAAGFWQPNVALAQSRLEMF